MNLSLLYRNFRILLVTPVYKKISVVVSRELEESELLQLDFNKIAGIHDKVIPAIAQDIESKKILMLGYVNEEALRMAKEKGLAVFYSTSQKQIWIKGSTSNQTLKLKNILVNCEQNSILYLVQDPEEGACHTRGEDGKFREACYYREIDNFSLRFLKP